mgnify:CR=1 FL=1
MKDWQGKTYWLVGASDGLGAALAHQLSRTGVEVILSARSEDKLTELAQALPGRARVRVLDVTDDADVAQAAKDVGPIDGLVYLAGAYWPFGAQEWQAEHGVTMADVNFTGLMRVLGQVVPEMVARDHGHIVITSSLTAYRGLPGSIGYTASKAATGVQGQVINPGFIKTQLTDKNDFKMPFLMEPEDAARRVYEHMNGDSFKLDFPYGFSLLFRLGRFLPDWLYYRFFS